MHVKAPWCHHWIINQSIINPNKPINFCPHRDRLQHRVYMNQSSMVQCRTNLTERQFFLTQTDQRDSSETLTRQRDRQVGQEDRRVKNWQDRETNRPFGWGWNASLLSEKWLESHKLSWKKEKYDEKRWFIGCLLIIDQILFLIAIIY